MFDKFKKEEGGEMVEERPEDNTEQETTPEPTVSETTSQIGIGELMGKRARNLKRQLIMLV